MRCDDGRLHVPRGTVDIAVYPEGQLDVRRADAAARRHVVHIRDGAEVTLQRGCDRARHDFRARPGKLRRDEDGRYVDAGERRDRQKHECHGAAERHADRQQRRRHRPTDERRRQVHVGLSASVASS